MSSIRAELHSHSTFSDGVFDPETVALMCAEQRVAVWSLTDHDTCAGCPAAATAAADYGVRFVPGIEVSSFAGRSIHVLGYGIDPGSSLVRDFSERRLVARHDRMRTMVAKLRELGVAVELERVFEIAGEGAVARPHLAKALLEAGHVDSVDEAFDRWISDRGAAYVETTWPTVPEAIDLIARAGGVSVLAHPGIYDADHLIGEWVDAGLDGIEVRHPKHSAADRSRYEAVADAHRLLKTGSSDYHGPDHLSAQYFGDVELPSAWVEALLERIGTPAP